MAEKLESNELTLKPEPAGAEAWLVEGAVVGAAGVAVAGAAVTGAAVTGATVGATGEGVVLVDPQAEATTAIVASATK
jgi:hypothetical protein